MKEEIRSFGVSRGRKREIEKGRKVVEKRGKKRKREREAKTKRGSASNVASSANERHAVMQAVMRKEKVRTRAVGRAGGRRTTERKEGGSAVFARYGLRGSVEGRWIHSVDTPGDTGGRAAV